MNIFVAKLGANTSGDDLNTLFSEYGAVSSAKVVMDRDTGQSKRFGFVEMESDEEANNAIAALDGCEYDNSTIVVKEARPREERPQNNFRRNDNRGGYGRRDDNRGGYSRRDDNRGGYGRRDDNRSGGYGRRDDFDRGGDRY